MGLSCPPGSPTRDEVLAVSLAKLGLTSHDTAMDIGCGSGKVSLALARTAQAVYAMDRKPEAVAYAKEQASLAGVSSISFLCGDAADLLPTLPTPDCAFVGGSHNLSKVIALLTDLGVRSVVVNAVQVSSLYEAITSMQEQSIFIEAVHIQISRTVPIGRDMMFRPENPVFIIVGGTGRCS